MKEADKDWIKGLVGCNEASQEIIEWVDKQTGNKQTIKGELAAIQAETRSLSRDIDNDEDRRIKRIELAVKLVLLEVGV